VPHPDFRPRFVEQDDPAFLVALAVSTALAGVLQILVWSWVPPDDGGTFVVPDRIAAILITPDRPPPPPPEATGAGVPIGRSAPEVFARSPPLTIETVHDAWDRYADNLARLAEIELSDEALLAVMNAQDAGPLPDGPQLTYRTGTVDHANADIGPLARARVGEAQVSSHEVSWTPPAARVASARMFAPPPIRRQSDHKTLLVEVLKGYKPQVVYCYQRSLKLTPGVQGRVELQIDIADGRAQQVEVLTDTTGAEGLADCLVRRVRSWGFPAGIETRFFHPFAFSG